MAPELFMVSGLAMGAGIGADVALASAGAAALPRRARRQWLAGVTATHTLFPMAGYLLTFFSARWMPALLPVLGVIAAGLIGHFYLATLRQPVTPPDKLTGISWPLLLAISWDALWSGPAKSAQVLGWAPVWVWLSFLLVGLVVLGFGLMGLTLGQLLLRQPICAGGCHYLQLTILGYFGALALCRYSLPWHPPQWSLLAFSALVTALLQLPRHGSPLVRNT